MREYSLAMVYYRPNHRECSSVVIGEEASRSLEFPLIKTRLPTSGALVQNSPRPDVKPELGARRAFGASVCSAMRIRDARERARARITRTTRASARTEHHLLFRRST